MIAKAYLGRISNAPAVIAGFLIFGPFKLIVDASSNAWSRVDNHALSVELAPVDEAALPTWRRTDR